MVGKAIINKSQKIKSRLGFIFGRRVGEKVLVSLPKCVLTSSLDESLGENNKMSLQLSATFHIFTQLWLFTFIGPKVMGLRTKQTFIG